MTANEERAAKAVRERPAPQLPIVSHLLSDRRDDRACHGALPQGRAAVGKQQSARRDPRRIRLGDPGAFPPLEDSDLVIRKLGDSPQCLVASPSVSKAFSRPLAPADLASLPGLDLNPAGLEHEWQVDDPDGATATIPHRPRFATEDMMALRLAALRGIGVCRFATFVVADDLNSGRPVDLLPECSPKAGIIHAVFPSRRGLLPSVRALLDFLATEYAAISRAALPSCAHR